jgi:hypothetical protein
LHRKACCLAELAAHQIGEFARACITRGSQAAVIGVTSQGTFLQVDGHWVIFLSAVHWAGPLIINLPESLPGFAQGTRARVERGVLCFQEEKLSIDTNLANLWTPPTRPAHLLTLQERHALLRQVARRLLDSQTYDRPCFAYLLAGLFELPLPVSEPDQAPREAFQRLRDEWSPTLRHASVSPGLASALVSFLGLGSGLTPSGDDLLAGLLLALNRWGDCLATGFPLEALNRAVQDAAHSATTSLSASLLECAASGQAAQGLVEALDGLMSGQPGPDAVVQRLQGYGASSGLDTLVGFSLAISHESLAISS